MSEVTTILLEGISQHGKNRIREHGNRWRVVPVTWMAAVPEGKMFIISESTLDRRWIKKENDPNFRIISSQTVKEGSHGT